MSLTREENLVNDVCDDDQEGVAKVEQKPFLNRLDSVSAAKTGKTYISLLRQ